MACVYILYSEKADRFYTGSCYLLEERLIQHKNKVYSDAYTRIADDWELYFFIDNLEKEIARKIEFKIKAMKFIQNLRKCAKSF